MSERSTQTLLDTLIGFATVSRDSNLELIVFIRDYLRALGVHSELFYNDERTKANLFATLGPDDRGGIVLSGHTDVVPIDGQPWTVDPFRLTASEDRLYGRGTADMKGFIASVLAAVPAFLCPSILRSHTTRKSDVSVFDRCLPICSSVRTGRACA
jgi:acetylornithine deacetylase